MEQACATLEPHLLPVDCHTPHVNLATRSNKETTSNNSWVFLLWGGHYVYKSIWTAAVGENWLIEQEVSAADLNFDSFRVSFMASLASCIVAGWSLQWPFRGQTDCRELSCSHDCLFISVYAQLFPKQWCMSSVSIFVNFLQFLFSQKEVSL